MALPSPSIIILNLNDLIISKNLIKSKYTTIQKVNYETGLPTQEGTCRGYLEGEGYHTAEAEYL